MHQPPLLLVLALSAAALTACSGSEQDELREWMAQQRAQTKPKIKPIAEPKKFQPQIYATDDGTDPFDPAKLTQALRRDQQAGNQGLLQSQLNRPKEPLEAIPLDAMTMVGSLNKKGALTALVKVDHLLYQVRLGNYLGQNYGKITQISENAIQLREIIQDVTGEWIERNAELALQETRK